MQARQHWYRDPKLQTRMFLVMMLLVGLYLAFAAVLWYAGASFVTIAIFAGGMALFQYFFSDKLVIASMGAKQVTPAQAPELHAMVERLAQQMDLPKPKVYWMNSDVPNAFATGRNPQNAVVCVTDGIMRQLDRDEMVAVLGHELSHVKNRDVFVMALASFFATVAGFITQWGFFMSMGRRDDRGGNAAALVWLASFAVSIISTVILIPMLSRQRELAADRGSAVATGRPGDLIAALQKISGRMNMIPQEDLRRVESANAFFIVPALRGLNVGQITSTHPSLEQRIEQLQRIQRQMEGVA